MAPTRELVVQIGKDVNRFAKSTGFRCVCVYGGTGVGSQVRCATRFRVACTSRSLTYHLASQRRLAWCVCCHLTLSILQ